MREPQCVCAGQANVGLQLCHAEGIGVHGHHPAMFMRKCRMQGLVGGINMAVEVEVGEEAQAQDGEVVGEVMRFAVFCVLPDDRLAIR